jgi:hypothetical protein
VVRGSMIDGIPPPHCGSELTKPSRKEMNDEDAEANQHGER